MFSRQGMSTGASTAVATDKAKMNGTKAVKETKEVRRRSLVMEDLGAVEGRVLVKMDRFPLVGSIFLALLPGAMAADVRADV